MIDRVSFLYFFVLALMCASCNSEDRAFTSHSSRAAFRTYLYDTLIHQQAVNYVEHDSVINWDGLCWGLTLAQSKSGVAKDALRKQLSLYPNINKQRLRSVMEAAYCCYPTEFSDQMKVILQTESNNKLFAMAAVYLYRSQSNSAVFRSSLDSLLVIRNEVNDPIIEGLQAFISDTVAPRHPPINDLFAHQSVHGKKVIYSFQNKNRDLPGYAILQYEDGGFARNTDGSLIRFPQLARSASNLPSFLTNGNTPQGVLSISSQGISNNKFIGPTPAFICYLPFEVDIYRYLHSHDTVSADDYLYSHEIEINMNEEHYFRLFPLSWQHYTPMLEAYRAGKAGRSEIHAHGTTIDPSYYNGQAYYPFTPSMGCLCAKEIWEDGVLLESAQQQLIDYYNKTPAKEGFLIVIDDVAWQSLKSYHFLVRVGGT